MAAAPKSEARTKKAPKLTVDGALRLVEGVRDWRGLGGGLRVPYLRLDDISQLGTSKRMEQLITYWMEYDPFPSWRRLICALDDCGETAIAKTIYHYAEPLTDPTLTIQNMTRALATMPYDHGFSRDLGVPYTIRENIESSHPTSEQRKEKAVKYYVRYAPGASWSHLAGWLHYHEQKEALQHVQRYIQRPAESTLTQTNLCDALEGVKDWYTSSWLNIPASKLSQIKTQHSDPALGKEAMVRTFLEHHPTPSWAIVTEALYRWGQYEEECHHILQKVRRLYGTGSEESKRLFDEAMKQGYVETVAVKVVITGAAGSGKTCSTEVILGRDPPQYRVSTPVAQRPVKLSRAQAQESNWEVLTEESIQDAIAKIIQSLGIELPTPVEVEPIATTADEGAAQIASAHTHTSTTNPQPQPLPTAAQTSDQQFRDTESTHQKEATSAKVRTLPLASSVEEKLLKLIDKTKAGGEIPRFEWVYFVDSGGQPQFHEILPVFLKGASICIYVQKLSERLDEYPLVEYYDNKSQLVGKPYRSTYTNEQIFQHCTRTMHSHRSKAGKGKAPKILILGTHADLEHDCSETREAKNQKLLEVLQPSFRDDIIYYGQDQKQVIFPLNAKEPGEAEHQLAKQIRELILCKGSHIPDKIPLCWYVLEQALQEMARRQGRVVLTREECFAAALQLHLDEKSFMAALEHLDGLNILSYYRNILPEVVFTDTQVLLDKATELVRYSHQLKVEPKAGVAFKGEWEKFRDYGLVTTEFLSAFKSHYIPGIFTATELIKLFRELLMVADLNDSEFFMTSLLQNLDREEVNKHRASDYTVSASESAANATESSTDTAALPSSATLPESTVPDTESSSDATALPSSATIPESTVPDTESSTDTTALASCATPESTATASESSTITPLVVQFPHCALLSMFCSLITYLLSNANRHPKAWKLLLSTSGSPECLFRNCVEFSIPGYPGSVCLIDTFRFFEAHIHAPTELHPMLCPLVRDTIFEGIERASTVIGYNNSRPVHAIICPCKNRSRHSAILSDTKRYWICSKVSTTYGNLEGKHTMWLGNAADEVPPQSSVPSTVSPSSGSGHSIGTTGLILPDPSTLSGPCAETSHVTDRLLDKGDQFEITTYLARLDKTTVYLLGQALGLNQWKVKQMRDSETFVDDVIAAWLRREDHVERMGRPTWKTLVRALRHPRIEQNGLANDISKDKNIDH